MFYAFDKDIYDELVAFWRNVSNLLASKRHASLEEIRKAHKLNVEVFSDIVSDTEIFVSAEKKREKYTHSSSYVIYYTRDIPAMFKYNEHSYFQGPSNVVGFVKQTDMLLDVSPVHWDNASFKNVIREMLLIMGDIEARWKVDKVISDGKYSFVPKG